LDTITIIGLLAGALTTIAYIPQAIKVWRTKETRDLSIVWLIILTVGELIWIVYGALINSVPVIATNVASVFLALIILGFKAKYK
jgi:MtN3 and saliva related transmembrane protein